MTDEHFKEMIEGLAEEEAGLVDNLSSRWVNEFNLPDGYIFKDENGNVINAKKIVLEKLVVPKFKKGDKIKDKNNRVWYVVQVGNKHFDISHIPDGHGYFVPMEDQDDYELFPDRELPKTYKECCKVLGILNVDLCFNADYRSFNASKEQWKKLGLMNQFYQLLICRDAYWKIAGEEMGLGEPWKPDYTKERYIIGKWADEILTGYRAGGFEECFILEFPTKEMRDAFKENFKSEIESCKEFL